MEDIVTYESDMVKLTVDNYSYWKAIMEDHLVCIDLAEPIYIEKAPAGRDAAEWKVLNRKAVATIRKYIDRSLFEHVSNFDNA